MTVCEILKLLLTSSTTLEVPWELSTLASPLLYAWHLGSSSMSYWTRRHQTQLPSYTVVRTEAMGGEVCVCFVAQSWPPEPIYHIDCDPVDHSLPGSSVHGDSPGILKWIAMPSSRGSSQPRDQTLISCLPHWQADSLPRAPSGKPLCCLILLIFFNTVSFFLPLNLILFQNVAPFFKTW